MSRKWRPSNGTDGEIWMGQWCWCCAKDTFDEETLEGESCPILMTLLIGDLHPAVTAADGELSGTCSEFAARERTQRGAQACRQALKEKP